jgi:ABC-type sugar transport system permease subunit
VSQTLAGSARGGRTPRGHSRALPYVLLAPAGLLIALFSSFPFLWAILIGFQPPRQASSGSITGFTFDNLVYVLTNPRTLNAIWVTLVYALLTTFLCIALSILTALALRTIRTGSGVYQLFLLIPLTIAPPVVVILWRALFQPSTGAVNGVLGMIGIPPQGFYESTGQALFVLVAMAVWINVGFWTLVFLAALGGISQEVWEAAEIDGAGPVRKLFDVTLPLLKRTILLASVVLMTAGLAVFIPAQLLTHGGPGDSTYFLMYMAAEEVLRYGRPGSANATVVLILALIAVAAIVLFRVFRSDDA